MTALSNLWRQRYATTILASSTRSARCQRFLPQGCVSATSSVPRGPFLNSIIQRTSDIGFSAPLINQEIASYLLDNGIEAQIEKVNNGYQQKAKQVKTWIAELLGDNIQECRGGSAGFYFYLTLANVATGATSDFFKFLTRTTGQEAVDGPLDSQHPKVIYIPGEHCVHPNGDMVEVGKRQLRISYGFEELPQIHTALKLMKSAIGYSQKKFIAFNVQSCASACPDFRGTRRWVPYHYFRR